MTESQTPPTPASPTAPEGQEHGHHGESHLQAYLVVFGALIIFTAISFLANTAARHHFISSFASFVIILGVAVCKATLVGMYFMHLITDWGRVFLMIVPALVLAPLLIIVLLPDIVLAWQNIMPP